MGHDAVVFVLLCPFWIYTFPHKNLIRQGVLDTVHCPSAPLREVSDMLQLVGHDAHSISEERVKDDRSS